jgi:TldD protein
VGVSALDPLVEQKLLAPTQLTLADLEGVLSLLHQTQLDEAELYLQWSRSESYALDDGMVKEGHHGISQGIGIRALVGEKTGFAHSDDLSLAAIKNAALNARSIARSGGDVRARVASVQTPTRLYRSEDPIVTVSDPQKVEFLKEMDRLARARDARVSQVSASIAAEHEIVLVVNSAGFLSFDVRPLVRVNLSVILNQHGRREQGYHGIGGRYTLTELLQSGRQEELVERALHGAMVNLEAIDAPAGPMTVVLGSGWPGVMLHEAVGHTLEGDFNRKGTSAFSNRLGEQIANPLCTVVDDGTLPGRRGSLSVDDEGTPSQCTTLIEQGVLVGYMQDRLNARLMGVRSTGNGRRESYASVTLPRMTNTYMRAGEHTPEEIIQSVDHGLYAVNFGGGQVDITSGKFVFSASEAYLIENGKITAPVKGATLIGSGPEVLSHVSMVGNDLKLDTGIGICGKEGQSVPVGVGQPTLKIDVLTVGGTA